MTTILARLFAATLLCARTGLLGCSSPSPKSDQASASTATTAATVSADSSSTPAASLPQQIADVVVQLNGGIHTGFRFMHAKGIVVSGNLHSDRRSQDAEPGRALQRASGAGDGPLLQCPRSCPSTRTTIPDPDPAASPSASTSRAGPSPTSSASRTTASWSGPVRTSWRSSRRPRRVVPDVPHPKPIETFLGAIPEPPSSVRGPGAAQELRHAAYFGNNAFVFVDGSGKKQPIRYQIVPVAGVATLDSAPRPRRARTICRRRSSGDSRPGAGASSGSTPSSRTPATPPTTARSSGPPTGSGCCSAPSA